MGFPWAVRAMALVVFILQAISIPFIKERLPPSKETRLVDVNALKDVKFVVHALGGFFTSFGESLLGVYVIRRDANSFCRLLCFVLASTSHFPDPPSTTAFYFLS
jgi:hypothetical protein